MIDETAIWQRYEALRAGLDERGRRLFAAAEARAAGFGGVTAVARATGIARSTIDRGLRDLAASVAAQKIRRAGGGRLPLTRKIRRCWKTCGGCSSRRRWAIRCDRCCGCRKATPNSPRRCATWDIAFPRAGFPSCSNASAIGVRSIARARKADAIPIATRNSSTSTRKSKRIRPPASRSSRSTPRRRN